jgi:hypothetical protein
MTSHSAFTVDSGSVGQAAVAGGDEGRNLLGTSDRGRHAPDGVSA